MYICYAIVLIIVIYLKKKLKNVEGRYIIFSFLLRNFANKIIQRKIFDPHEDIFSYFI